MHVRNLVTKGLMSTHHSKIEAHLTELSKNEFKFTRVNIESPKWKWGLNVYTYHNNVQQFQCTHVHAYMYIHVLPRYDIDMHTLYVQYAEHSKLGPINQSWN